MGPNVIQLISVLAWPTIALIAIITLIKTDFLTKNISELARISKSVDDLKIIVSDMQDAEEKLKNTGVSLIDFKNEINELSDKIIATETTVGLILDRVDSKILKEDGKKEEKFDRKQIFKEMQDCWYALVEELENKFGWFDRRAVGSMAYRFSHGNRRHKLPIESAEEISELHSEIKSYLRRAANLDDWLDQETGRDFIERVKNVTNNIGRLPFSAP